MYTNLNNTECSELVCKYGLDADYMRSAFITKCKIESSEFINEYLFCATASMDNYKCCQTLGINHECCYEFMGYQWKFEAFNTDKFLSHCIDIFKAIAYCPILHF
uniref:Uncharacterized protein n=1 Tax=Panagrolaimus sp. PS1159 TaxID=55785 RepID=A0AC35GXP3_9BILA